MRPFLWHSSTLSISCGASIATVSREKRLFLPRLKRSDKLGPSNSRASVCLPCNALSLPNHTILGMPTSPCSCLYSSSSCNNCLRFCFSALLDSILRATFSPVSESTAMNTLPYDPEPTFSPTKKRPFTLAGISLSSILSGMSSMVPRRALRSASSSATPSLELSTESMATLAVMGRGGRCGMAPSGAFGRRVALYATKDYTVIKCSLWQTNSEECAESQSMQK
mmetsp:Transcript_45637/g.67319  ORF Transcript_45637/g.67319 Transcript_45637/m.67319 type:complete len:224 (+) Transcript_45637:831-1502(+)